MKKLLALLLASIMVFALVACGGNAKDPADKGNDDEKVANAADLLSDAFIDPINDWAKYDKLIADIKAETDYAKRVELMHEAEDILMSNGAVIPLYYYNDVYMQKDYVDGVFANLFGYKFFYAVKMGNDSDTLRLNLASEPDFLDPALNSSVDGACLAVNSFAGLYTYDAEGKTVPDLAVGYEVSEPDENGYVTYTVTLKDDLKWSDGSKLDATDFEYSWKRAASSETASDYGYMFSNFVGYDNDAIEVKALDAKTLEFKLIAPCAYIEGLMAFPTFFPVPKAAVEANADYKTTPGGWCTEAGFISNGPFVCTSWKHDTSMTYEKNPNYHNADAVTVDKLEFMLSADDTAIYAAYNAGNVDFIDSVPTDEIASLLDNDEFKIVDNLGTYYVAFNVNSELFEGKTAEEAECMRLALIILIERDYICENVGQTGQVAASSYIPLGMADGNGGVFKKDAEANSYYDALAKAEDPEACVEKAIEYLKAAGYKFEDGKLSDENPIVIDYLTNNGTGHVAAAESMQQDFAEIGIVINIVEVEWNTFLQERKNGNFDIAREGWLADFDDPINMLEMFTTDSGNNDCQYGRYDGWDK